MSDTGSRAARLAAEGVVIVVSILAAFALDTAWERAQEREEERETLLALRIEFQEAAAEVQRRLGFQEQILSAVSAVADSLNQALSQGRTSVVLPDTMLAQAYIPPTTSVGLGTLRGLIGSGRLGIVRSRELRARLGAWGSELDELREEELDSRSLAYGDLDRTLRSRMNTYGLWATGDSAFAGTLSPEGATRSRTVPVDTEVLGVFHLRASILRHAVDEFAPLTAAVDSILRLIDAELPSSDTDG